MLLDETNTLWLEAFAGSTIFKRGVGYFNTGKVYGLNVDTVSNEIVANVSGNYGNYEVNISDKGERLEAYCDCPYDGYPCKHIVAVCLQYMENKQLYRDKARNQYDLFQRIENELSKRSKPELIELLMQAVTHSTELRSIVALHLFPDSTETEDTLLSRVDEIDLEDFHDDFRSEAKKARQARELLRTIAGLTPRIKIVVSWRLADKILNFLNEYGVDDERWENIVLDILEEIVPLLKDDKSLADLRDEIYKSLVAFYQWGNCGLIDAIDDYAQELT